MNQKVTDVLQSFACMTMKKIITKLNESKMPISLEPYSPIARIRHFEGEPRPENYMNRCVT